MRILAFVHRTEINGGANRSFLMIVEELVKRGHAIEVILPRREGELNRELTEMGIPWRCFPYTRMNTVKSRNFRGCIQWGTLALKRLHHLWQGKRIAAAYRDRQIDAVYMNTVLPYCALFAAESLAVPAVVHVREPFLENAMGRFSHARFLYDHAERLIVISGRLEQQWKQIGDGKKVRKVLNGIPVGPQAPARSADQEGFHVLLTARLTPEKRQEEAIAALAILKRRGIQDMVLHLAGHSEGKTGAGYEEGLKARVRELGLTGQVVFHGEVKDMAALRSRMDTELMCNPDEPFGRVTVEGMRAGLAVIGANGGGTLDILQDGETGLLYQAGNPEDLADRIEFLYRNPEEKERIAGNAGRYGRIHFTVRENVDQVEQILKEAVRS